MFRVVREFRVSDVPADLAAALAVTFMAIPQGIAYAMIAGLPPMVGLYAAVTRKGMSGAVYGTGERLSMEEAIRGYTANGAFITREEATKGTLEPGRLADMIVLSEDLLTVNPDRILGIEVELTVVGGNVVYERSGEA